MKQFSLTDVARYFAGSLDVEEIKTLKLDDVEMNDGEVWCHLPPLTGRMSMEAFSTKLPDKPITIHRASFLFIAPCTRLPQPGIAAFRTDDGLRFQPVLRQMNMDSARLIRVASPSAEVLCRLVDIHTRPFLHFKSSMLWIKEAIESAITSHLASFPSKASHGFFSNSVQAASWVVASKWDQWDSEGVPTDERIIQLRHSFPKIREIEFFGMNPAITVARLKQGSDLSKTNADRKATPFSKHPRPDTSGKASDPATYQNGFAKFVPSFRWDTDFDILKGKSPRGEDDFRASGVWWWQRFYKNSDEDTLRWFVTRREEGAFFYEFRARIHSTKGLPSWDAFARPWCELNEMERDVLSILWPSEFPTERVEPMQQWRSLPDRLRFIQQLDFAQPLTDLLEEVKHRWKEMEPSLIDLWGKTLTSRNKSKVNLAKKPTRKVPERWKLLELLDLQNAFGSYVLSRQDKMTFERQHSKYSQACNKAGILP